ncbi:hypothetical protein [uncultured Allofournierella sp.]|uniref:hypothetical protein n=1 Tax=uncultured Allofournierella sp. TaxID=1940258 RepID=UPI0037529445
MGLIRRLLSIGLGVAAGAVAYKLLSDYNKSEHIEGEYVNIPQETEEPTAQAAEPKEEQTVAYPQRPDRGPNVNPVSLGTLEKPIDEATGKLDATRIASPEDFGDWDEWGCQG